MSYDIPKRKLNIYELQNIKNVVRLYIVESVGKS